MKMSLKGMSAALVIGVASIGLVAAGCSTQASDSAAGGPGTDVQMAANEATYAVAATGTVSMGFIKASITGGSISGSTGTVSLSAFGNTFVGDVSNASVSPTSLTATLTMSGETGTGTLNGSNYVYSGTITSGGSTFKVSGLTLKPQAGAAAADTSDAVAGAPAATSGNYAVKATGTVTADGTDATITGGSISGSTGTVTVKYWITFTLNLSNVEVSPTSLSATVSSSLGSGSGTLTGSNYVYSGTIKSGSDTVTVTNLTLVPTT